MKKKSFMLSVAILAVGGLVAKIIGAVYRIPLTYVLGAEGLGIYQLVFPLYSLLIIISSSGVPTAISKMISTRHASGKYAEIKRILLVSLITLSVFGLIAAGFIFVGAEAFAKVQGNESARLAYMAIAPAVLFVSVLSTFRGLFQGLSRMAPTAFSQILEQITKLIMGLLFASLFISKGLAYGAFGAVLGVTISEIVAVLYMFLHWVFVRKRLMNPPIESTESKDTLSKKTILKELVKTALPITLASAILPFSLLIDSLIVVNLLKETGYTMEQATIMYGLHSGVVNSVINMPVVITLAVATAVVPALCFEKASGGNVRELAKKAIRVSLLLAMPCMLGLALIAPQALGFLYDASLTNGAINEPYVASLLLSAGSVCVLLLAMLQVCTSILQSLGYSKIPVYALFLACVVKVLLSCLLIAIPEINILGAVIANIACFLTAVTFNYAYIRKKIDVSLSVKEVLIPLLVASVGMSGAIVGLNYLLRGISVYISVPVILVVAVIIYVGLTLVSGGGKDFVQSLAKIKKRKV